MGKNTAIILGSKPGSVIALRYLLKRGWQVVAVVTDEEQADWLPGPNLYEVAKKNGIKIVKNQSELDDTKVDLVISYMCRAKVNEKTRSLGRFPINFHAAPLPRFGGWAFYNIAILESSPVYGCTCHIMDDGFDTGPLVKVREFPIEPSLETAQSLEKRAQTEMVYLFSEVIKQYEATGKLDSTVQPVEQIRYMNASEFMKLKEIPLNSTAEEIDRIARAFWYPPYSLAYFVLPNGNKVEVIPECVKENLAKRMHKNDYANLCDLI